ncbi:MAG: DNA repair protein RadC, partial [Chloroflexi bacterium]|nr:DNA repair protein RadC [Chloroflexota bacterium]MBU1747878.1 DNA repair protein RadC [Chloroflexota bacterium]
YALMARFSSLDRLAQASLSDLCQVPGVGQARACQILAALELGRRHQTDGQEEYPLIQCPADAARLLRERADRANGLRQEEVHVLLLNTKNRVVDVRMAYRGTLNASPFRPADLLREAVRQGAAAILIGHNHPSHEVEPSPEDVALTRELAQAGELLGIPLLDHLILGGSGGRYCSLKEQGHLP